MFLVMARKSEMSRKVLLCILVIFIVCGKHTFLEAAYVCDDGRNENLKEGNIGTTGHFPWLGVLKVHIHEGDNVKIAVTGIVLVKETIAVGNADDIAKIPRGVLLHESKAMFIPSPGMSWITKVKSYLTHPEHPFSTRNTIAILELKREDFDTVLVRPICWPSYLFNASDQLYAVGFQDDNQLLEKHFFKMSYVKTSICDQFYNRSGLSDGKMAPKHVQCAYSKTSTSPCEWDTGVVLASNATGKNWTMIGLGIQGPGCASPARFIDIFPYLNWIEASTTVEEINEYGFRRVAIIENHNYSFSYTQ